jgi:hypothetical protein
MDGTQQKPLTIYESDSESNPDSEHPEDTMIAEDLFEQSEEITAVEQLPSYAEYPDPAPRTTTMSDDYPEADDESVAYNSEVEMAFDDGESVASVKGSSEADYTSELDISDDEDEADAVVQKPDTKSEPEQSFPTIMLQDPSDFSPVMALPTNSSANASFEQATSNTASDSPSFGLSSTYTLVTHTELVSVFTETSLLYCRCCLDELSFANYLSFQTPLLIAAHGPWRILRPFPRDRLQPSLHRSALRSFHLSHNRSMIMRGSRLRCPRTRVT